MNLQHPIQKLTSGLLLVLALIPTLAWCTSGEVLLQELRQQVDMQRQKMSPEDLQGTGDTIGRDPADPGDVIECTPAAIAAFHAYGGNHAIEHKWSSYLYNATYTRVTLSIGTKYCVYLTRPVQRGLMVPEARDLYVADHLDFPRYNPPASDLQIAEDQFLSLRDEARAKRDSMPQQQRDAIEADLDHDVECTDKELSDAGYWHQAAPAGINEDIDSVNYVWGWGHSIDGDPCLFIRTPLNRALTIDETRDFLTMTREPLQSLQFARPISEGGARRKAGIPLSPHPVLREEKKISPRRS